MSDLHPAVALLLAAHEQAMALAEEAAEATDGGNWRVGGPQSCECCDAVRAGTALVLVADDRYSGHVAANDPASVLRRVTAEREILAEHAPGDMARERDETECRTCSEPQLGFSGMWAAEHPCRTVLGLAKAWGWEAET